ncbi:hypothetical protein A9X84_09460 [Brachyspira hyodysenteriae]|uniref:hypothetical protein n=1 Tax=Brachyspira hyodysenteriae TaxID=159 RepID=UPI00063D8FF8|nr:hypothetical protein [Brachyspira hyodysenteriae]KLI22172.1 hypothetical protein SR30_11320 [Brachyspira hyodysenteriae]TVL43550.1 hypothetical protein A9X84_09460 [Brachyspira hyodysenteriae]TVL75362.1 hypothetical protein A9X77_00410 [Brachyspira hyodysenteriae]TVL85842.1 hypothetical protein A9X78_01850 [Brachyspira hyodysenteriae]
MKFYFTIIIFILITSPYSFAQNNYNLNIKFRVIEKFDKILSSDNKEYVFYIDANYIFSDEGKTIYSNNIYNIQNTLNDLERQENEAATQAEKNSINQNIRIYKVLLTYNTPPKKFITLLINRQIHQYISKYPSSYIDDMLNNNLQAFYDDIRNNIVYNEKYTGKFTSIKFLTKDKFKYYTGRT